MAKYRPETQGNQLKNIKKTEISPVPVHAGQRADGAGDDAGGLCPCDCRGIPLLQLWGLEPAAALSPSMTASRPSGCVVPIFPFLQHDPSDILAPGPRQRRPPLAIARPGPPGPRERSHSAADGRPENGRNLRVSGKDHGK